MGLGYYIQIIQRRLTIEWKRLIEYKVNFILVFFTILLEGFIFLLFWRVIFLHTDSINTWHGLDIVLLYFFAYLTYFTMFLFAYPIENALWGVIDGDFDRHLIYPMKPFFSIVTKILRQYTNITHLIIILSLGIYLLRYFNIVSLFIGVIFSICGILLFIIFYTIIFSSVFWTHKINHLYHILIIYDKGTQYPLTATNKVFQKVFTYVYPIIFVATVPAEFIRGNFRMEWLYSLVVLLIVLFFLARVVWRAGLRRYESGMG